MVSPVRNLEEPLVNYARARGFRALGPFSERHGSWEILFHKSSPRLERFVALAITQMPQSSTVEFRAGADSEGRFGRRSVMQLTVDGSQLQSEAFWGKLARGLDRAIDAAERFEVASLANSYISRRRSEGRSRSAKV